MAPGVSTKAEELVALVNQTVFVSWSVATGLVILGLVLMIADLVPRSRQDLGMGLVAVAGMAWFGLSVTLMMQNV